MPDRSNSTGPRVTLHMVSSLDGFIAKHDNDIGWLENAGSRYDAGVSLSMERMAEFVKGIDCYVMGSHTYEHALQLGWVYGETPTVVVTSRNLAANRPTVEFYSGDLATLVHEKLAPRYRNLWLVGGALLGQRFLELGLVDEIRVTLAPVLLGDGLRMFHGPAKEQGWNLKEVVAYKNGFVELTYAAKS